MRILVLEDNADRVRYFLDKFSFHELTITENAQDAINYLNRELYDCIFLDHDLGHNNGSGTDVSSFLSSGMSPNIDAIVIIHSWNTPAVAAMQVHLPNAYALPYGSKEFEELEFCTRGS